VADVGAATSFDSRRRNNRGRIMRYAFRVKGTIAAEVAMDLVK
jgi:hypothetical protein